MVSKEGKRWSPVKIRSSLEGYYAVFDSDDPVRPYVMPLYTRPLLLRLFVGKDRSFDKYRYIGARLSMLRGKIFRTAAREATKMLLSLFRWNTKYDIDTVRKENVRIRYTGGGTFHVVLSLPEDEFKRSQGLRNLINDWRSRAEKRAYGNRVFFVSDEEFDSEMRERAKNLLKHALKKYNVRVENYVVGIARYLEDQGVEKDRLLKGLERALEILKEIESEEKDENLKALARIGRKSIWRNRYHKRLRALLAQELFNQASRALKGRDSSP